MFASKLSFMSTVSATPVSHVSPANTDADAGRVQKHAVRAPDDELSAMLADVASDFAPATLSPPAMPTLAVPKPSGGTVKSVNRSASDAPIQDASKAKTSSLREAKPPRKSSSRSSSSNPSTKTPLPSSASSMVPPTSSVPVIHRSSKSTKPHRSRESDSVVAAAYASAPVPVPVPADKKRTKRPRAKESKSSSNATAIGLQENESELVNPSRTTKTTVGDTKAGKMENHEELIQAEMEAEEGVEENTERINVSEHDPETATEWDYDFCLVQVMKDEMRVLERCYTSVLSFLKNGRGCYHIADTGSSDGSPKFVEKWMEKNGVEGTLVHFPWVNFGKSKSKNLELAYLDPRARRSRYWIWLDCDEDYLMDRKNVTSYPTTADVDRIKKEMDETKKGHDGRLANIFYLLTVFGSSQYKRWNMSRNCQRYWWKGPVHELFMPLDPHGDGTSHFIESMFLLARKEGNSASNPKRILMDIQMFEDELKENPECQRTMFYLAQSYEEAGKRKKAIAMYKQRIAASDGSDHDEERYIALLRLGRVCEKQTERLTHLERATKEFPTRLEAAREIFGVLLPLGPEACDKGAEVYHSMIWKAKSEHDLFVERNVYDWFFGLDASLILANCKPPRWEEAFHVTSRVLAGKDSPDIEIPAEILKTLRGNLATFERNMLAARKMAAGSSTTNVARKPPADNTAAVIQETKSTVAAKKKSVLPVDVPAKMNVKRDRDGRSSSDTETSHSESGSEDDSESGSDGEGDGYVAVPKNGVLSPAKKEPIPVPLVAAAAPLSPSKRERNRRVSAPGKDQRASKTERSNSSDSGSDSDHDPVVPSTKLRDSKMTVANAAPQKPSTSTLSFLSPALALPSDRKRVSSSTKAPETAVTNASSSSLSKSAKSTETRLTHDDDDEDDKESKKESKKEKKTEQGLASLLVAKKMSDKEAKKALVRGPLHPSAIYSASYLMSDAEEETKLRVRCSPFADSLVVIDGFLENPMAVREFALAQDFNVKGNYPGGRTRGFATNEMRLVFEKILGRTITFWPDSQPNYNGAFQYTTKEQSSWIHNDATDIGGILFLTPDAPAHCGTSFYEHKKTRAVYQTDQNKDALSKDSREYDKWTETDRVGNRFNRLILFDGRRSHCSSAYFGECERTGRLFQTFFFDLALPPRVNV